LPSDDATIRQDYPNTNYGGSTSIKLDHQPLIDFLMRFNVTGVAGRTVASARVFLYCTDSSSSGGDWHIASDTFNGVPWSENTVTWNTAPSYDSSLCSSCAMSSVLPGNWYSVDVTPLVTGDGVVNFHVTNLSPDATAYTSKEGATKPYLQVITAQ
jgi:hypothetical protein